MFGASRESLKALQSALRTDIAGTDLAHVGQDLLAVADVLNVQRYLRLTLADTSTRAQSRADIATELFGPSLSPAGLTTLQQVVAARWSHERDLVDALDVLGAEASLLAADRDGELDRVFEELFHFTSALASSDPLQLALTDPALSAEHKAAIVTDLVGATASPVTTSLLAHSVGHLRGRAPLDAITALSALAADVRGQVVADVRSPIALSPEQRTRLARVLAQITGTEVRLNVEIAPDVIGGIVVRVGDQVIDGTVAARLEQAHRAVSA
ncbi:MAG: F0F1 ATP synthase subunit delta [Candidatus Nanopelagicales bacterium]